MEIRRVAIIYDGTHRPETTGLYCRRALGTLIEVEQFEPGELARIPRTGFDLYLNVDDGLPYHLPPDLHPAAWWAIDTHLDFARCLEKSGAADLVFAAQRAGAEALRGAGIASATWLPLACDPEIHSKHDVEKQYDFAFVGHVFPGPRAELLETLRRRYLSHFVGHAYFEEMARIYSAARTVFNRSLKDDLNMRVFEALGCGSLLLTDAVDSNGQAELFRDGVHLATYRDAGELLDKLAFYLAREPLREEIAAAGRAEALARHTYLHRMARLLREAESALAKVTVRPGLSLPAAGGSGLRDPSYFGHARPEVLGLVPRTARRVLDIGCGAGRLGEALKARQGAEVVGIELDRHAAELARGRLDDVLVGDVERLEVDFPPGSFDAIVCGDILEHLREPDRLLRRARGWLGPGGRLVASIPNVRHRSVIRSLLAGNWTYESAGLLDRDHLRFFTRREIEKLFSRAGFSIEELGLVPGPGDGNGSGEVRRPGEVRIGRLHLDGLPAAEADEFHAYQYLLRAAVEARPEYGLTSIVIPTHDQLEYTRLCLDSVRRLTDEPIELIVVDNASTDGTAEYLGGLPDVRLIRNDANRGFPAASNQGIAAARGRQVLLLNNDTVATTGWLSRLLRALHRDPKVGLVGPCSNRVSGPQQVEVDYEDLGDLDGFAWDRGKARDGEWAGTDRLVGFCLLIRRDVVDAIGMLDERFGVGCFEDDDYCLRAIRAGFRAVIARDAFVHHFGGRTFLGIGVDFAAVMRENGRRFRAKWPRDARVTAADRLAVPEERQREGPGPFEPVSSPSGGLVLRRRRVRLSLCMIVRDSSKTLPACLESIRPWVDEMVVVDTGSLDDTPRIVEAYGGRLFHFPWCDDFSAARNESIRHARGEWVFWMDSDDTIPPESGRGLRDLVDREVDGEVLGFVMQVHCPGGGGDGDAEADVTVVDHVKLLRKRPDLRFEGRIHEQILPAIRRAGGEVAWTELYVVHSGSDHSPEAQERKRRRDLRILGIELAERPGHPFTLFNLGMTYVDGSQFTEGAESLRQSIAASGPEESHLRKAYALLVYAEMRLGRGQEALRTCRRGRELFPADAELRFREGVLLHELGRPEEAVRAYRDVLENREERHFASVDRGLAGFKARQNLAVVFTDMGRLAEAEREWRNVVSEMPAHRAGWRGLGEILLRRGRVEEASALAGEMSRRAALRVEGSLLRSRVALAMGDIVEARRELERALAQCPDDPEALRSQCQLLFEHGAPAEAEEALRRLIARVPDDASAHHNLGTVLLRARRHQEATAAYREALRHRPNHPATHLHLGYALKGQGRVAEASEVLEQALRLAPDDPAVREELALVLQAPGEGRP
jgi:GT2 family glycosyltransferase/tetratricopeptide (TPR) repeat protein/2-polyprenyl-3-methyl-5-hydroxy-6-metoxy-1,4-benzoquinol methylase